MQLMSLNHLMKMTITTLMDYWMNPIILLTLRLWAKKGAVEKLVAAFFAVEQK